MTGTTVGEMERRPALAGRSLWLRWLGATVAGELIGLGGAGALAVLAGALAGDDPGAAVAAVLFALMLAAGAGEGAVLGAMQSLVLRGVFEPFATRAWVAATAAGALVAWTLGATVVMSLPDDADPGGLLPLWMALGLVAGTVLGVAQWVVLRRYVARAGWWVAGNAAAWGLGLVVPFLGASNAPDQTAVAVLVALVTGLLSGVAPGAVTGWVLVRLLDRTD